MLRIALLVLVLVFAGCGNNDSDNTVTPSTDSNQELNENKLDDSPSTDMLHQLVYESFSGPEVNPERNYRISKYNVPEIWKKLKVQPFLVEFTTKDNSIYNQGVMIYFNGKVEPFVSAFGGFGLMSAALVDETMYYSYSWGSGVHRSHLGYLTIEDNNIILQEFGYFENEDVFVKNVNNLIYIDKGFMIKGFNTWTNSSSIGRLKTKDNGDIVIVKDDNTEIKLKKYPEVSVKDGDMIPTVRYLSDLVTEKIHADKPDYLSNARFIVEIRDIPELWHKLNILICKVIVQDEEVKNFQDSDMIYCYGEVKSLEGVVISNVFLGDRLYYSYFGKSDEHSYSVSIAQLWVENGEIKAVSQKSYISKKNLDTNLYLVEDNGKIAVETRSKDFINITRVGLLKTKESGEMVIVKDDGTEIRSKEYREIQQTQPKGD